jgi:hypothetical protein
MAHAWLLAAEKMEGQHVPRHSEGASAARPAAANPCCP